MHNGSVVISNIEVSDAVCSVDSEIVLATWCDVIPDNLHKLIAIVRRLHVMKAKRVNKFMDDCVKSEASNFRNVRLKLEDLAATDAADIRRATSRIATYFNVICLISSVD